MANPKIIAIASGLAIALLIISSSLTVAATNGQTPNRQILSSNTSSDTGSWVRFSMYTNQAFDFTSGHNEFSYQMNTLLNGAYSSCESKCSYTWWLQGIVEVENFYSGSYGAFAWHGFNQVWHGGNHYNFCHLYPSTPPNINGSDWAVVEQNTLTNSSFITYELTIIMPNGTNYYTHSTTCPDPSGFSSISYFNQVEGVIVGDDHSGEHVSFTPLSSTIFKDGYIDLVSNYNHLSSLSNTSQTAESSNLYQHILTYYSTTYGSQYLYTVQYDENTTTAT